MNEPAHIVFDWGDTLMPDDPSRTDPMCQWPVVSAFPDALQTLPLIAARCTLSIATNAEHSDEAMIRQALARVGLDRCFTRIFCLRGVGARKSDPAFWPHVVQALATTPDRVWMVGDDFEEDIVPAARFGIASFWLNRHTTEPRAGRLIRTIRDLHELIALVKAHQDAGDEQRESTRV